MWFGIRDNSNDLDLILGEQSFEAVVVSEPDTRDTYVRLLVESEGARGYL